MYKVPRRIEDVKRQIGEHPDFPKLDRLTRLEWEVAGTNKGILKKEDNKWLRELWHSLYVK